MALTNELTAAQLQTGWGVTSWDGCQPQLRTDEYVYVKSEYTRASGDNSNFVYNPYKVLKHCVQTSDLGVLLDADGNAADGTATADIDMNGDASDDTATEWPTFYELLNVNSGKKTIKHESELLTLAGVQDYIGTEVSDWADPS